MSKKDRYDSYKNAKGTEPFKIDKYSLVKFSRSFTYLGIIINFELNDTEDIKVRVEKASKAMKALHFICQSNKVTLKERRNIYKAIVMNLLLQ